MKSRTLRLRIRRTLAVERLEDRLLMAVDSQLFTGMGIGNTGITNPDTNIAVGQTDVVEVINSSIEAFTKGTNTPSFALRPLSGLFNPSSTPGGAGTLMLDMIVDPIVTYDELTSHFAVSALEIGRDPTVQPGETFHRPKFFLDLAVSTANDSLINPAISRTDLGEVSTTNPHGFFADRDMLGWNADAYVFTLNMYTISTISNASWTGSGPPAAGTFDHVQVLSINKANTQTHSVDPTQGQGASAHLLAPAFMHGASVGGPMWLVQTGNAANGMVNVIQMSNVLTAATTDFTSTTIAGLPAYDAPSGFYSVIQQSTPQQPTAKQINADDDRFVSVAWRNNRLLAAQTVGHSGTTRARWIEFNTAPASQTPPASPTLTQEGEVAPQPDPQTSIKPINGSAYYPAVDISTTGSIGIAYMESASNRYLSVYATAQRPGDPPGSTQVETVVMSGVATLSGINNPVRAGDYSGAAVDAVVGQLIWVASEFASQQLMNPPTANWGTEFAKTATFPPSALITEVYMDVLGRTPVDSGGMSFWSGILNGGQTVHAFTTGVLTSTEYRNKVVNDDYQLLLHRPADAAGRSAWYQFLVAGGTFEQLKANIAGSPEYFQNRGAGTNNGFVTALYRDILNRDPDSGGLAYWTQQLQSGVSRYNVAFGIITSTEALQRVVQGFYKTFLHRDADTGGLNFWVTAIQQGTRDETAIAAFLESDEHLTML